MSKWHYNPEAAHIWWEDLSLDDKVKYKKAFTEFGVENAKSKFPYPHMYDLSNIRISKLGDKHIVRIWVFRDRL